jgi:hypothetical protein
MQMMLTPYACAQHPSGYFPLRYESNVVLGDYKHLLDAIGPVLRQGWHVAVEILQDSDSKYPLRLAVHTPAGIVGTAYRSESKATSVKPSTWSPDSTSRSWSATALFTSSYPAGWLSNSPTTSPSRLPSPPPQTRVSVTCKWKGKKIADIVLPRILANPGTPDYEKQMVQMRLAAVDKEAKRVRRTFPAWPHCGHTTEYPSIIAMGDKVVWACACSLPAAS